MGRAHGWQPHAEHTAASATGDGRVIRHFWGSRRSALRSHRVQWGKTGAGASSVIQDLRLWPTLMRGSHGFSLLCDATLDDVFRASPVKGGLVDASFALPSLNNKASTQTLAPCSATIMKNWYKYGATCLCNCSEQGYAAPRPRNPASGTTPELLGRAHGQTLARQTSRFQPVGAGLGVCEAMVVVGVDRRCLPPPRRWG